MPSVNNFNIFILQEKWQESLCGIITKICFFSLEVSEILKGYCFVSNFFIYFIR